MKAIRKAVFPVAGLGTRFLPATKAVPKEMLPIVDKPLIHYAVEEAQAAGIDHMIFITARGKQAIEDHFDSTPMLAQHLRAKGYDTQLAAIESARLAAGCSITVRQGEPRGLGHAVGCARDIIGDEPFAVILPDEFMIGRVGCMQEMVALYKHLGGNIVSVHPVPRAQTCNYGVIIPKQELGDTLAAEPIAIKGLVEKPAVAQAPSNLIISGRYILQPEIFPMLEAQTAKVGGEIQLTDAMVALMCQQDFHGHLYSGQRYDCGAKIGYVTANLATALAREDLRDETRQIARQLLDQLGPA